MATFAPPQQLAEEPMRLPLEAEAAAAAAIAAAAAAWQASSITPSAQVVLLN